MKIAALHHAATHNHGDIGLLYGASMKKELNFGCNNTNVFDNQLFAQRNSSMTQTLLLTLQDPPSPY